MSSRARRASVGSSSTRDRSPSPGPVHQMHYWEIVGGADKKAKSFALAQRDKNGIVKILNTESNRYVSPSGAVGRDLLRDVNKGLNAHGVPVDDYLSSLRSLGVNDFHALGAKRTRAPAGSRASSVSSEKGDIAVMVSIDGDTFALGSKKYENYLQYNPEKLIKTLVASSDSRAHLVGQALQSEFEAGHLNPNDKREVYIDKRRADGRVSHIPVIVGQYAWVQNLLRTGSTPTEGYMTKERRKEVAAENKLRRSSSGAVERPPFDISIPAGAPRRGGKGASLIKYGGPSHIKALLEGANPKTFEQLLEAHAQNYNANQIQQLKDWVRDRVRRANGGSRSSSPTRVAPRSSPVRAVPSPRSSPVRSRSPSPARSTSSDFGLEEEEEEEEEYIPPVSRSPPRGAPATRVQATPARTRRTAVQQ